MTIVAFIFSFFCLAGFAFQLALVFGAPWGEYTMGGMVKGVLPLKLRLAAALQSLILIFFGVVALNRAGLILPEFYGFSRVAIWAIAAFFVIGSIANWSSPSKKERLLWGPVNVVMLALSLILAIWG